MFSVNGLARGGDFKDVSFEIRAGEILGLAGLVGAGRSELARALFGADRVDSGTMSMDGKPLARHAPFKAIRAGISFIPENRKEDGLLMERSVRENTSLSKLGRISSVGLLHQKAERARAAELIEQLRIVTDGPETQVSTLSGGNQQKVMFAKGLFEHPMVLIADEPTRGVDVGAKHAIYELLGELAGAGLAILLISSEFEEVLELSHRILVMHQGRIVKEFDPPEADLADLVHAAFGDAIEAVNGGRQHD